MDIKKQLENQLLLNRKINKKLPPELRLPETEKEFVERELLFISEKLEIITDESLVKHIKNREQKLIEYLNKTN